MVSKYLQAWVTSPDETLSHHSNREIDAYENYRLAFSAPSGTTALIRLSTPNPSCSSRNVGWLTMRTPCMP